MIVNFFAYPTLTITLKIGNFLRIYIVKLHQLEQEYDYV